MANIIVTILERLKITAPFRNEKADYFLMHNKDTGEVCAVPEAAILSKVNSRIDGIIYPDGFTKTTPITRIGNTVTINAYDFAWRIKLNPYSNADGFTIDLEPTSLPGLKRIDTLAVTKEGTIVYYMGEEDEFFIQAPDVKIDEELRLTDLTVFGNEVQDQTEPIITEIFTKEEKEKLAILDPTADIDKPVSTAQALADGSVLQEGKDYTDDVAGTKLDAADYNDRFKGVYLTEVALNAAHPTGNAGDSAQVNEVGSTKVINYSWDDEDGIWVDNGSGGSSAINTDALPEGSSNLYFTVARFLANLTAANIKSALGITTLTGSNTGDQDLSGLQAKDTQVIVGSSTNVQNSWSGKTVYFTANCTITVPSTLDAAFIDFGFRTMTGVTVTWAITSPFTWETTPTTTPEKTDGLFTRYNGGNVIILRW